MQQQRLRIAMVFDHPAPGFCSYYRSWTLNFVVKQCPIISIAVALLLLLLPQRRNKDLPTRNPAQLFLVLAVMGPATRWSRVKRSKTIMKQKSRRIASAKKVIPSFKWIFPLHSLKCNADASTKKKEKLAFKICSSNSSSFFNERHGAQYFLAHKICGYTCTVALLTNKKVATMIFLVGGRSHSYRNVCC